MMNITPYSKTKPETAKVVKNGKKKPLDIIRTPGGCIALITETEEKSRTHSIDFITKDNPYEKNAWWNDSELEYITSIPVLLTNAMAHPFGSNTKSGEIFFPND